MADELKEETTRAQKDEVGSPEAEAVEVAAEAESEPESEAEAIAEEERPHTEPEAIEKSPEEIAAEEAMLAKLKADAESHEEEPVMHLGAAEAEQDGMTESPQNIALLMDVSLLITVELGRKEMKFSEVLRLGKGSLVELNKIADEPVDIYVNQSKIAEGEVVVVDDHFGVRITRVLNTESMKRFG